MPEISSNAVSRERAACRADPRVGDFSLKWMASGFPTDPGVERTQTRLNEAAGAADATRGGMGSGHGWAGVFCGHKEVPVTQLRKKMLEELQRRNYAQSTVKGYLRIVQDFAQHFHQPPDKLGPDHLRQYQAHLFQ